MFLKYGHGEVETEMFIRLRKMWKVYESFVEVLGVFLMCGRKKTYT